MRPQIPLRRLRAALLICSALSLATAGCTALQEDSLGPAAARPAPDPLGAPQDPTGTSEFGRNDGVDIVNAEAAYARGATGAGVTVAVVDTGIDADHPDLAGNVSSASFDITTGSNAVTDATGHGTKVAGVVAAERNGLGTHGVAYDATILAVNTYNCGSAGCGFYLSNLASAVNYATDQLAHVINLSLSAQTGGSSSFSSAVRRATDAGAFVVIATGNDGNPQPGFPANVADQPGQRRMVVAVGAVTDSGSMASFSNDCGAVMNACLVAPGVSIATTRNGASTAGSTTSASGTSFATPHVSGALALLIQLYPDAYAGDPSAIATFLFDGARDLGAAGVDPVYGHGLVDVAGSIAVADTAIAAAEVPLPSGGSAGLSGSSLVTSAAFGDGPGNAALLDDAIAVISLSDGDHAYRAGLADSVTAVARGFGLDALLAAGEAQSYAMPLGGGLSLSMAVAGDPLAAAHDPWAPEGEPLALQLSGALGAATGLRLGIDVTAADQLAAAAGLADGLFWSADETMRPLGLLTGRGNGLSLDHALGDTTRLSLGLFDGETANGLLADGAAGNGATLGQAGLRHGFASGASFGVDVGLLAESAAMLGSQGAGALSTEAGADTRFLTVGGGVPLGDRLELFGSMTLATSEVGESADSLLTGWDSVQSNALALGAIARDVAADGDRLGLLVGQPLRAYRAEATVTVPVDVTADGAATLQSERVDLTPSGREIDFQLAYDRPLAPGMGLSTWLLFQLQPGHDADADPAYGAGLRFRFGF